MIMILTNETLTSIFENTNDKLSVESRNPIKQMIEEEVVIIDKEGQRYKGYMTRLLQTELKIISVRLFNKI